MDLSPQGPSSPPTQGHSLEPVSSPSTTSRGSGSGGRDSKGSDLCSSQIDGTGILRLVSQLLGSNRDVGKLLRNPVSEDQYNNIQDPEMVTKEMLVTDDIIIVLMGPTGSGKSSFIETATGVQGWVGHSLDPCTNAVQAVRVTIPGSVRVVLVDTPGFGKSYESDLDILKIISDWLRETYEKRLYVSGILYMHCISDSCMATAPLKYFDMLEKLCGENMYHKVIIATTMWQDVDRELGIERELELKNSQWAAMIKGGSETLRFDENTRESAWKFLNHIITQDVNCQALRIQNELVDFQKDLLKPQFGQQSHRSSFIRLLIKQQKDILRRLRMMSKEADLADPAVAQQFASTLLRLQEKHDAIIAEMQRVDSRRVGRLRRLNENLVGGVLHTLIQTKKLDIPTPQSQLRSLISSVMTDRRQRDLVSGLTGDNAQLMVDYLNLVLHETSIVTGDEGKRLLSSLCNLARIARVYPQCYILKGVEIEREPVSGGGFADVYRGQYEKQTISLKLLRVFQKQEKAQILRTHVKELVVWAHISHHNLLPFYGVYHLDKRICLVSPWMKNGNLHDYLRENPETPRMPFIPDIVDGLVHLHQSHIVHGDLKAKNILVSDDGRALITDFGVSYIATTSRLASTTMLPSGTTRWKAPELFKDDSDFSNPTQQSDIWSFACLCYEILTSRVPFYQYRGENKVIALLMGGTEIPARPLPEGDSALIDDGMWGIMTKCWNYAPQERPTCEAIQKSIAALQVQDDRPVGSIQMHNATAFWREMRKKSDFQIDYERVREILMQIQRDADNNIPVQSAG